MRSGECTATIWNQRRASGKARPSLWLPVHMYRAIHTKFTPFHTLTSLQKASALSTVLTTSTTLCKPQLCSFRHAFSYVERRDEPHGTHALATLHKSDSDESE